MPQWETVAIVGVGLIGGSLGLALRRRKLAKRVIGIARRESSAKRAVECGTVHRCGTELSSGVAKAEVVVVCTPVESIVPTVKRLAPFTPADVIVTDAGSTKKQIVSELGSSKINRTFIGSHPMAGSEKMGPEFADKNLFDGRTVVLTPTRKTPEDAQQRLQAFWESVGAEVVITTPSMHDQAVAATSHVPHLLASILSAATPVGKWKELIASGWRDTTRIASGDPEIWRQIVSQNREFILNRLLDLEQRLADCRQAIAEGDDRELTRILKAGKRNRDALGS